MNLTYSICRTTNSCGTQSQMFSLQGLNALGLVLSLAGLLVFLFSRRRHSWQIVCGPFYSGLGLLIAGIFVQLVVAVYLLLFRP